MQVKVPSMGIGASMVAAVSNRGDKFLMAILAVDLKQTKVTLSMSVAVKCVSN